MWQLCDIFMLQGVLTGEGSRDAAASRRAACHRRWLRALHPQVTPLQPGRPGWTACVLEPRVHLARAGSADAARMLPAVSALCYAASSTRV